MPEPVGPTENDIMLDLPTEYQVKCVVCGAPVQVDKTDDSPPSPHTFSFGFDERSAFCSGVVFVCQAHEHVDHLAWTLAMRLRQMTEEPEAWSEKRG